MEKDTEITNYVPKTFFTVEQKPLTFVRSNRDYLNTTAGHYIAHITLWITPFMCGKRKTKNGEPATCAKQQSSFLTSNSTRF